MKIRSATSGDASALGRIMVASWLSAHRDHIPDAAWRKREAEWTPDVSARAWARTLIAQANGDAPREVLLVAEDDKADLTALAYATPAVDDPSGSRAALGALYVSPAHRGKGIGSALVKEVARELADLGFVTLRVEVLTANLPARSFYETMGALEISTGTFDEEGYILDATVYEWPDITALIGDR